MAFDDRHKANSLPPLSNAAPLADHDRVSALYETNLMDSGPEERFDRLTRLVSASLSAPVALVSLVDTQRQFFKSTFGLPEPWNSARETPLTHSFCQHVVDQAAPLVIDNAMAHPLVKDNLAIPDIGVQAYLGIPLLNASGQVLGSLCAIDSQPRKWTAAEHAMMTDFARLVEEQIALRERVKELARLDDQRALVEGELAHRIKNIFSVISSLLLISSKTDTNLDDFVRNVTGRIHALSKAHDYITGKPAMDESQAPGLSSLLHALLAPFKRNEQQVLITCDPVIVGERAAASLSLVIHELATNAAKYGALSVPEGHIEVMCTMMPQALLIRWREKNGPAITAPPQRKGFGSKMMTRTIEAQLSGRIEQSFLPEGLSIDLHLPIDRLVS